MLSVLLLLLAQDVPPSAVDTERKMAQAAKIEGQWTAVRRFAAPDAMVMTLDGPAPVARVYTSPDPAVAFSWSAADSYVSCDGSAAVNTGPWDHQGSPGYFTTVWRRQSDGGWKWELDSGDALPAARPRPAEPRIHRASCDFQRSSNPAFPVMTAPTRPGHGKSDDGTLLWDWQPEPGGRYSLTVWLWNGRSLDRVIHDVLPADQGG